MGGAHLVTFDRGLATTAHFRQVPVTGLVALCPGAGYFFCSCGAGEGTADERFFALAEASMADNLR